MNAQAGLRVRIAHKRAEAEGVCSLELHSQDGELLPPFEAGAHIDLVLPGVVRQYSLCNDPAERHRYLVGVLHEPQSRGGSRCVHEQLREGDALQISHPRNLFPLSPEAPHSVLFAGGIGITPILAMAEQLAREGRSFELHYAVRSASRAAFAERLRAASYAARVRLHVDTAGRPALDFASVLRDAGEASHLYVCGPRGFIDAALAGARRLGWAEARLHTEYFSAAPHAPGDAFDLVLARSGRVVRVAAGQSAVAALGDAGVEVPVSCEQGICGTCLTPVIEGEPDHRDSFLTPEERSRNDCFTPCCSRAKTARMTVDL